MGIGKIIIGIVLVIIGIWLLLPYEYGGLAWWQWLLMVLMGAIPVFLIFIGAILVWIESEELKIERPSRKKR
jgi:uncharacterized membrane protein